MRCVVDLHCHSSASFDSKLEPADLVRAAAAAGLTHLAITDHDQLEGALLAKNLAPEGLTIIVGQEIRSSSGDLIALFVNKLVPSGLSPEETVAAIRKQKGLVGLPHGFDPYRPSIGVDRVRAEELKSLAAMIDYVEIHNGRVVDQRANERAAEFAHSLGIPGVAASDAHTLIEVGTCAVVLNGTITSAATLRRAFAHPGGLIVKDTRPTAPGTGLGRLMRRFAGRS